MRRIAITRDVAPNLHACELTHVERIPIDVDRAHRQHEAYRDLLRDLGCEVRSLPALPDYPDSVFVEDAAVVIGGTIVLTRPGAASRRGEVAHLERSLGAYGPFERIVAPGTLDGGDVLVQGHDVFVGRTSRTNEAGIEQLADFARLLGFTVRVADVRGCLHLKSAATSIGPDRILVNPDWVGDLNPYETLPVDPDEAYGANVLRVGDTIVIPTRFPRTAERLRASGLTLRPVDNSELAKAEGALTCCSVILERE